MGKLVKFGEYFYEKDPSATIKNVVDRFLRTGYLSNKNIEDLESVGISKNEFLKIYEDLEFCKEVRNLLYDEDQWDLFNKLLFELEVLYDDGVFNMFSSNVSFDLEPINSPRAYSRLFNKMSVSLDMEEVLLKVLNEKNNGDKARSMRNNSPRNSGNSPKRKAKWFDVDIGVRLSLTFEMQSIYKNTASFGYTPLSELRTRACNILSNDVMFKFLKLNGIDKFEFKCVAGYSSDFYQTFDITVKRNEKSAEQSADFFII